MISFDLPLEEKEFVRRVQKITREGKPLTMRNVDPKFCKDYETSSPFYPLKWILSKITRRDYIKNAQFDLPMKGYRAENTEENDQ